jgi:MoaA/NifB/PqqE/SkfB family radical SAM enzyme
MYIGCYKQPFSCNYWVTYRCNSRCQFCKIWKDASLIKIKDAVFDNAKINLDHLKKIGATMIDFTGGEPLLNPELPQILSYAKQKGFFVKLSTNGFLYPEYAKDLKGTFSRIYFSFDAVTGDDYKMIRGIDGYERLLESIKIAKDLKEDICLSITLTNETIKNISSFAEFCNKQKVVAYIHPCFSYFKNEQLSRDNIKLIKKYFWHPYIRMNLLDLDFYYMGGNDVNHPSCLVGKSTLDISPDDYLLIPCFHHYLKKIKINGRLLSIFNSKEWKELYNNNGRYDFCNHCSIDCYFGLSYFDKIKRGFFKENLTMLKYLIENNRPR